LSGVTAVSSKGRICGVLLERRKQKGTSDIKTRGVWVLKVLDLGERKMSRDSGNG